MKEDIDIYTCEKGKDVLAIEEYDNKDATQGRF